MISKTLRAGAMALTLAGAAVSAHATPVSYTFTAVVDAVHSDAGSVGQANLAGIHVALGDVVTGRFTYDAATAQLYTGSETPDSLAGYYLPDFRLEYTLPSGVTYANAIDGFVGATDTAASDSLSFYQVGAFSPLGTEVSTIAGVVLVDDSGKLLTSATLPAALDTAFPGLYGRVLTGFSLPDGSGNIDFSASLTSFKPAAVSAVPEPGTYLMLLAGLGALGVAARRRHNAA